MDKKWRVAVCLGLGIALTGAALAFQIVNRRISDIVSVDSEQIRQENRRSLQGGPLRLGPLAPSSVLSQSRPAAPR